MPSFFVLKFTGRPFWYSRLWLTVLNDCLFTRSRALVSSVRYGKVWNLTDFCPVSNKFAFLCNWFHQVVRNKFVHASSTSAERQLLSISIRRWRFLQQGRVFNVYQYVAGDYLRGACWSSVIHPHSCSAFETLYPCRCGLNRTSALDN